MEESTLLDVWNYYKIDKDGKILLIESITYDNSKGGRNTCHNELSTFKRLNITF